MSPNEVVSGRRIITVSNRLPITVRNESGKMQFSRSVGGLATGLSSYIESLGKQPGDLKEFLWVGWPGTTIGEGDREEICKTLLKDFGSVPVFLSEEEIEKFYQGFCNKTIWPLFHYFQVYTNYDEEHWKQYAHVNRSFCETLLQLIRPGDTIWIHDYHLMLLPTMIRAQSPSTTIGFFLHIPFPNFEIFRLLPSKWRREILQGLLGADLIGFHTNDYRQDFLKCVIRILGHDSNMGEILVGDRISKAESFPMGIDYRRYNLAASDPVIRKESQELRKRQDKVKIILSIDRLDYTKGIVSRLEGFEAFLETYSQWHSKVVLMLIVVPSRIDVDHYEMMKNQIEGMVGKINGRFGSPVWTPIIYMFKTLTFDPLVAMYASADIALITPLRDGMNLIAKEYIASRTDKTGVLILSEMAGSSKELLEAVTINPNNRQEIADALFEALNMPKEEQIRRNAIMQQRLRRYDVVRWATDFIQELANIKNINQKYFAKMLTPKIQVEMAEDYRRSRRRLILLDYDGTLVPFTTIPQNAVPSGSLRTILRALSENPLNQVVIVSGRERAFLDRWITDTNISLVAEHGAWIKEAGSRWKKTVKGVSDWKIKLKPLFELYVDRIAGSTMEEKNFALVWHYRGAEPERGKTAAQELMDHLLTFTANIDVHILQGNKNVEVRVAGVNKGTAGLRFLSRENYDFILSIGDDTTDEDLFEVLPETAYSLRVGIGGTRAKYNVSNVNDVALILEHLALSAN
jgi:trehalose 6-phosphate synthase/phosphatase